MNLMFRVCCLVALMVLVKVPVVSGQLAPPAARGEEPPAASGEDAPEASTKPAVPATASPMPAFSEGREAAALVLVKQLVPELLEPLQEYRRTNFPQYELTIRRVFQWSELLADGKLPDTSGIKVTLQAMQAQLDVSLLAAKLLSQPDQADELKQALRKAVENSVDFEITEVQRQITQSETSLVTIQKHLEKLRSRQEQLVNDREKTIASRLSAVEDAAAMRENSAQLVADLPIEIKQLLKDVMAVMNERAKQKQNIGELRLLVRQAIDHMKAGQNDDAKALLEKALKHAKE